MVNIAEHGETQKAKSQSKSNNPKHLNPLFCSREQPGTSLATPAPASINSETDEYDDEKCP